jgi:hypothetical protein
VLDASTAQAQSSRKPVGQPSVSAESNDEKEILIVQAMEQPTSLRLENANIGEAVRILSEQTGVPIEFDRFVLGCLPYGSKSQVNATIENRPLKESLTALLNKFACRFVLEGDKLVIQPRPALFRICRRATWDEVVLIEQLYGTPWSKELAASLEFHFVDMSAEDADANRKKIYQAAASMSPGHAARVLEYACRQNGWAWYPEGKVITICTAAHQVERQLQRTVTVQYSEVQLEAVLLDLVGRAGLTLKMEPGALASLPTQQRERFRMMAENLTIRQALELIVGETGLKYSAEADGIRIAANPDGPAGASENSAAAQAATVAALRSSNPIVGQITIPGENGTTFSFFLREQDLPPDVNQLRLQQLREAADKLRNALSTRPVE